MKTIYLMMVGFLFTILETQVLARIVPLSQRYAVINEGYRKHRVVYDLSWPRNIFSYLNSNKVLSQTTNGSFSLYDLIDHLEEAKEGGGPFQPEISR